MIVIVHSHYVPLIFFFFTSRRRHTRCSRDWSSDVSLPISCFRHDRIGRFAARHDCPAALLDEHLPIPSVAEFVQLVEICGCVHRSPELVDADRCKSSNHCCVGPLFGYLFNGISKRPTAQLKPTIIVTIAPAAAPCKRRVTECPCRIEGISM